MRLKAIAALLSVFLVAAHAQDDETKKELARFQGTWSVTSAEKDGQEIGADSLADFKLIVQGNKRTLKKGDQVVSDSTFKVDPKKNPKVIYVSITEGPFKDKTLPGIYEFDSDTQKVCIALNGIDPPKDFTAEAGSGHLLQVFKKEKN